MQLDRLFEAYGPLHGTEQRGAQLHGDQVLARATMQMHMLLHLLPRTGRGTRREARAIAAGGTAHLRCSSECIVGESGSRSLASHRPSRSDKEVGQVLVVLALKVKQIK